MKTDPIQEHLRALPDAPLPETLWPRLQQRQRERVIRRRRAATGAGLVAVVLGVALSLSSMTPLHVPFPNPANPPVARLQAVDRALQTAYANGASDEELAPLWDMRERLLSDTAPTLPLLRENLP